MVSGPWVEDLEGFYAWIRGLIDASGVLLAPATGNPHFGDALMVAGEEEVIAVVVEDHRLALYAAPDAVLEFSFVAVVTRAGIEYEKGCCYRLTRGDRELFRFENHEGHPDLFGDLWHVHRDGSRTDRAACGVVDLDYVLQEAQRVIENEPSQETPQGAEIPVPQRSLWDRVLNKAARPVEKEALPAPEAGNNGDG